MSKTAGHFQRSLVLDQLRSCAVLLVVAHHVVQMSPNPLPRINAIALYGRYGVDLFFILSGWLIGGLYWQELKTFGHVDTLRFWLRRWMRTLPPYFVALVFSWLAIYLAREEYFDSGYLVFIQNYYGRIPFFLVSWSLCIEEHFYLTAPLIADALIIITPRRFLWAPWAILIALSLCFRWWEGQGPSLGEFGYFTTATHLRLDGLVLGFGLSYLPHFEPAVFKTLAKYSPFAASAGVAGLVALEWGGEPLRSIFWPTTMAALCAALVLAGVSRENAQDRDVHRWSVIPWRAIAAASYSAYLVHSLAIHVARNFAFALGPQSWFLYWPTIAVAITGATVLFYTAVERPSISLRDAWLPSRATRNSRIPWRKGENADAGTEGRSSPPSAPDRVTSGKQPRENQVP
jgi:peptidoglycan/LPS O-acetylase OafA/YrhL